MPDAPTADCGRHLMRAALACLVLLAGAFVPAVMAQQPEKSEPGAPASRPARTDLDADPQLPGADAPEIQEPQAPQPPAEPAPLPLRILDRLHDRLSLGVLRVADTLDDFFGDERIDDEVAGSRIRVTTSLTYAERREVTLKHAVKGKVALPRLRNRVHLILDSFAGESSIEPETDLDTEEDEGNFFGLRTVITRARDHFVNLDGKVRFHSGLEPGTDLNASKAFSADGWGGRIFQSFFWFLDDGFGEMTRLDLERRIGARNVLRGRSEALWSETSEGVELRQSLVLAHPLGRRQALEWILAGSGHTSPSSVVDRYSTLVRYRRRILRDWLFLEIVPQADYPRERDYNFTPQITFELEIIFGSIPRPARPTPPPSTPLAAR